MRILLRPTSTAGDVWADAAFGPVHRESIVASAAERGTNCRRRPRRSIATSRVFDDAARCTIFSDGLAEYEARDDGTVVYAGTRRR